MKNIFVSFIILIILIGCSKKDSIVIPLSKVEGYGPFNKSGVFCFENPSDSILIENVVLPDVPYKLSLRVFHTQSHLYNYYSYKSGNMSYDKFSSLVERHAIDTTILTDEFVDESILIAIGKKDKNTVVCFVDSNNDNLLTDEDPILFLLPHDSEAEKQAKANLLPLTVNFNNYDGTKVDTVSALILLNPYKGSLKLSGSWASQEFLSISLYEHRLGILNNDKDKYQIILNNRNISNHYTNDNVRYVYTKYDDTSLTNLNQDRIDYSIQDVINIDNNDYRIDSIDFYGENLFITNLGTNKNPTGLRIGNRAPNLNGMDINNQLYSLDDFKGKYILLDFWGTWCKPCIAEIPYLKEINMKYTANQIQILSVAVDNDKEKVIDFINEKGMNWIHFFQSFDDNSKNSFSNIYKVQSYPTTYLIDAEGTILNKNIRGEELINTLDKLLN